jgi:hypothetical protein
VPLGFSIWKEIMVGSVSNEEVINNGWQWIELRGKQSIQDSA